MESTRIRSETLQTESKPGSQDDSTDPRPKTPSLDDELRVVVESVDRALLARVTGLKSAPARLVEAMRYSIESGGKRLRPALVLWSCEACGGDASKALSAALAIECVHTFSLIHDDLPAIDNDDLRRGRPTNHRVFGESTAILAGDALVALAFEILADEPWDAATAAAMTLELSRAMGAEGMIGGELADIEGESSAPSESLVRQIHEAKTARLIQCACRLGALAAGAATDDMNSLSDYGRHLGLAFQVADDLLDETGVEGRVGKRIGKDSAAGKQTYPRAMGIDASRQIAVELSRRAVAAVKCFGPRGRRLEALAQYVVERSS